MKYVIGDVHGQYKTLKALLKKLPDDADVILVGDIIDRGPDARSIINMIKSGEIRSVKGNHEDYVCRLGMNTSIWYDDKWPKQYKNAKELKEDLLFIEKLPLFIYEDGLLVSHSIMLPFLSPGDDISLSNPSLLKKEESILYGSFCTRWGGTRYHDDSFDDSLPFNVFGHTTIEDPVVKRRFAAIDTGAGYGFSLTAISWPEREIIQQPVID